MSFLTITRETTQFIVKTAEIDFTHKTLTQHYIWLPPFYNLNKTTNCKQHLHKKFDVFSSTHIILEQLTIIALEIITSGMSLKKMSISKHLFEGNTSKNVQKMGDHLKKNDEMLKLVLLFITS